MWMNTINCVTYKKKKTKQVENEQVITFSNPSAFQWPPYIYIYITKRFSIFRSSGQIFAMQRLFRRTIYFQKQTNEITRVSMSL